MALSFFILFIYFFFFFSNLPMRKSLKTSVFLKNFDSEAFAIRKGF